MMDSQKLLVSRENPRPLAFPTARLISSSVTAKSMPTEIVQKPIPSIVDRFKALLKQRDDELRAAPSYDDDDVPPPSTEEIVQLYELMLSELTFNSKPIITDLTIIAGEQREHGKGIADAICARILEVSVDQKLPSLYLLDSIVKNIGQEYVRYFSSCLPEVFCEAYRQVEPNMHHAMRHLFGTWSTVFPPSVLRKIEAQLQFSQAINNKSSNSNSLGVSESSRPTHGIHVNPKYLRQLEHSTVDNAGGERLESTGSAVQTSFGPGKIHPPFTSRLGRVPSPSGIGLNRPLSASIDEYPVDSSTGKMVESESPSHAAFDYGVGKAIARDEELSEWSRKQLFSDSRNRFPISATYSHSNGHQRQSPRALIDAYGSDKRNEISSNKSLLVDRLDINGMDKVVSTSWQNTEEEEFDWEDMNPTLVDNSRNNGFLPSFSGERSTFSAPNAASLEQDTRSSWSGRGRPQFPLADDSAAAGEDASVPLGCGRGLLSQVSGFQTQKRPGLGSRHIHDTRNISHHTSNPSQSHVGHARNLPMASIDSIPRSDIKPFGIQPSISRMGSSGLDSNVEVHQPILPTFGMRPPVNMHTARPPILNPIFPFQKHARSQLETINLSNDILASGPNRSSFALEQQLDGVENKDPTMAKLPHLSNNQTGVIAVNQQIHGQVAFSQPQFGYGGSLPQHSTALSAAMSSSLPVLPFPLPAQSIANNLVPLRGAVLPLPPAPPASSQTINHPNMRPFISSQQPATAFPGLINSLMAQGLISVSKQPTVQDSVGTEFNPDVLKVRHESAINALYADLPRQCTTCGLRFKCQEEHSSHMDWHVTKNRMSKSRKQKPSRKWFVSQSMWLSGAEALGTEAVPGFLPTETMEEKKDDDELAVPADEDQNTCALCGEPFDAFYSDEMEEWMYKGAVYLNAPSGATAGMDTSQLGPIVHAKCRTESSMVSSEDFRQDEGGSNEEGHQRKRTRIY